MSDNEIDDLLRELNNLQVDRQEIDRRSREITNRINELGQRRNRREEIPRGPLTNHRNRLDRYGDPLNVNDRVRFLTGGRVQSTSEGRVVSFTRRFVVCRDGNGREVNKEPQSLRKLESQEERTNQNYEF